MGGVIAACTGARKVSPYAEEPEVDHPCYPCSIHKDSKSKSKPKLRPNMKTETITPTLATQRVLANTLLNAKLNEGFDLAPDAFDWAVKILRMPYDEEVALEYLLETMAVCELIEATVTDIAKNLLGLVMDNGFVPLDGVPEDIVAKCRALHALVKANPPYPGYDPFLCSKPEEIAKAISDEVHRLSENETISWAYEHYGSPSALNNYLAEQIICEEMIAFEKDGEWVSFFNLSWERPLMV